jgi:hypothetical protein
MWLAPAATGSRGILDSVSHPLSVLQRLAGPGTVESARAEFPSADPGRSRLDFRYVHASGGVDVTCRLATCPAPPRPAAYAIDGRRIDREIDPRDYGIYFTSDARRVKVEDPLKQLVEDFLLRLETRTPVERTMLIESVTNLEPLIRAGIEAERRLDSGDVEEIA